MTTTAAANPTRLQAPALTTSNAGDTRAEALVTVYFRQSSDGVNFTVTPVMLHPADAAQGLNRSPWEYSRDGSTFAAWPTSPSVYNNASQSIGGRGRLLGASGIAN